MKLKTFAALLVMTACYSCQNSAKEGQDTQPASEEISVRINTSKKYQEIDHFGASDAWSTQFVGTWPEAKRNGIAELLFSQEEDQEGNPKGIGLSLWRFNIGAGSAEQGEESDIKDEWRRAESFLEADGSYNWDRQAGQVWFASKARELGVEHLLLFPNSPPVNFTKNGKAYATNGESNLDPKHFDAFGEYMVQVIRGLRNKGLEVDYISPVNEPQWDWSDAGQEGTPFFNSDIAGIARSLNKALEEAALSTKIDIAEAAKIDYLYKEADKPGRGSQVQAFFDPASADYIGDLSHMGKAISGHSYFTTSPFQKAVSQREELHAAVAAVEGLKYWMSEYCILGDNGGEINGNGRDLGIDPALYMAKVIHNDLTIANASAWHWWVAVSPYDYKDGLVYIDHQKEDGNYYESKMLWALGNYSKFIRPGFHRMEASTSGSSSQTPDILASAFQDSQSNSSVIVLVNLGIKEASISLDINGELLKNGKIYLTDKEHDLEPVVWTNSDHLKLPARSIATIVTEE